MRFLLVLSFLFPVISEAKTERQPLELSVILKCRKLIDPRLESLELGSVEVLGSGTNLIQTETSWIFSRRSGDNAYSLSIEKENGAYRIEARQYVEGQISLQIVLFNDQCETF